MPSVTAVAPYVGAWIETLKQLATIQPNLVAPYVGAWIETIASQPETQTDRVAPYVGAWIETRLPTVRRSE